MGMSYSTSSNRGTLEQVQMILLCEGAFGEENSLHRLDSSRE